MQLSVEDQLAVQAVAARMYLALDAQDAAGYASVFTENGCLNGPFGDSVGRQAILEWTQGHIAKGLEDGVRHFITNVIVEAHPEGARLRCYVIKMKVDVGPSMIGTGALDIVAVRNGDDWLFRRNVITIDPALLNR
jgi:uncharacterized protein (TIGR02246 family)